MIKVEVSLVWRWVMRVCGREEMERIIAGTASIGLISGGRKSGPGSDMAVCKGLWREASEAIEKGVANRIELPGILYTTGTMC
jgi:hypothetical protein